MLRAYGEVIENGAERVFRLAEDQRKHRAWMERIVVVGGVVMQVLGLIVGAFLCTALAYGGWVLAREGHGLFGIAAIILALGTPTGVFVYGRRSQSEERLRKWLALEQAVGPARRPPPSRENPD
jgi:MFS family permease